MIKENILKEVITGYRNMITERYQYQRLKDKYELPNSINEQTVDKIRNYFLDHIYPEFARRKELNEAFESLDNIIKRPDHLITLLLDSVSLVFSHGRHLPKILATGLKALKSFRLATDFEDKLVDQAIVNQVLPPYDELKIKMLIKFLSYKEIDQFIEYTQSLFEVLHDKKLINKIKDILQYLVGKMKDKSERYSINEIKGFEIGLEMLIEGDAIFNQLKYQDQEALIRFVINIERDVLNEIFNEQ